MPGSSLFKLLTSSSRNPPLSPPPPPTPPLSLSPRPQPVPPPPPPSTAFLCPITSLLMSTPILVPSGHSFDLPCIEACRHLNYSPPHLNLNQDFPLVRNVNLRQAICDYCKNSGYPLPTPISSDTALYFVRQLILTPHPPPPPPLPLPLFSYDPAAEQSILENLQEHTPLSDKESTLLNLIQTPCCSPRILAAVIPFLSSSDLTQQTLAAHVIGVFSATPINRTHILRCGAAPRLIVLLCSYRSSTCEAAVRALCGLSSEKSNRVALGSLGVIRPMLDRLCGFFLSANARVEAATALINLSSCRVNLEALLNNGAVEKLMRILEVPTTTVEVKKQLLGLVECVVGVDTGAEDFMIRGGVKLLLKLVKDKEGMGLCSMRVMQSLYNGRYSERFRELARADKVVEELMVEREDWEEYERGIARELVSALKRESSSEEIESN